METEINSPAPPLAPKRSVTIFGVGTAGVTIVELMAREDFPGAKLVSVNTDGPASTTLTESIQLESKLLRGLGTGGDPERGRELAEEHFDRLKTACAGAEVVMIVAGLGGGTGSGVSSVLARAARESGALVLAFVTLPFNCEGNRRQSQAQQALDALRNVADGVICLPHQKAVKLLEEHCGFADTFCASARVLIEGVRGVWRLLMYRGLIEIHFEELCAVLRERHGESCFATVESAGPTRARDAIEKLPAHPLLDGGEALQQADTVLVSLMGGPDLSMADVNCVMEDLNQQCRDARIIMGAAVDEAFRDRLAVTIIATRKRKHEPAKTSQAKSTEPVPAGPEFETELLHPTKPERPASRLVPPAPALTAEQRDQILAKQTGKSARGRKVGTRMKQTTLPLDIVNKGRFDKSEPTIHKGEDLDLPTYVRRGISLN
ncbi:MAG: cell division protein FtsZ [Verrucomicrobiota bacterium]